MHNVTDDDDRRRRTDGRNTFHLLWLRSLHQQVGVSSAIIYEKAFSRPRRRRLKAFTTDAKIIRLISRRVAIFPAAAARQIFDGDCDAANRKKISGVIPLNFRPCVFLDKWTEVLPVDKILHRPMPFAIV